MPWKRIGNKIYKHAGGKWSLKQTCKSAKNAISALRLLNAKERGWRPTGREK